MKINNVTDIRPDDFPEDDRDTVGQLAEIINPFMQQVQEAMDERIDFDNRVERLLQIDMTVSSTGVPVLNNKISTGKSRVNGFTIINAYNLDKPNIHPTGQPFIVYNPLSGGLVEVIKITNLPANNKIRLTIIVH